MQIDLQDIIQDAKSNKGLDVRKLKSGTKLTVETMNATYDIVALNPEIKLISLRDGHIFPEATKAYFHGSTWGGSAIRIGWLGHDLHLEFGIPEIKKTLTTTPVKSIKVSGDGWEYMIDPSEKPAA